MLPSSYFCVLFSTFVICCAAHSSVSVSSSGSGSWSWFPVPINSQPVLETRQLADGTTVRDCFDWRSGQRSHSETWVRSNAWKMECKNGSIEVIACIGSRRTNFAEIALGESLDANGFWHKCEVDGNTIKYSQERSCLINGQELHINDTFRNGAFNMKCEPWGYSIAGCYFYDANGEAQELKVGESKDVGIMRHSCDQVPEVQGRVKYLVRATACKKDGKIYQENETWVGGSLKFKCLQDGAFTTIACVMSNGTELAIGQDVIANNTVHRCYRVGRTTYYHSYACGFRNVSCTPKPVPIQTTSTQVVERTTMLKQSNGPVFSVVQPMPAQVMVGSRIGVFIQGVPYSSGQTLRSISMHSG